MLCEETWKPVSVCVRVGSSWELPVPGCFSPKTSPCSPIVLPFPFPASPCTDSASLSPRHTLTLIPSPNFTLPTADGAVWLSPP